MRIIGLTGQARAGKDTVGGFIDELLGERRPSPHVEVTGFAHKLKLSCARLFYPDIDLDKALSWCDWLKTKAEITVEEEGLIGVAAQLTGRQLLQRYGTEAHRDTFGEDFWLDAVLPAGRDDCDVLVIVDARFENEVQRIRDRGGEVWQILRPDHENPAEVGAHASEQAIPAEYVSHTIINAGTLDDLEQQVLGLL